jgi:CubicO group peptidase (beta-lactamase class C family)
MRATHLSAYLTILLVSTAGVGQQASRYDRLAEAKVDRFVKQEMVAHQIPGVSLAVLRRGQIVLLKSYGFANVEHQAPVKPSTIFQSGSIGKQFTAAAVMILVQENKLSLDDKISKYFPDAPPAWKDITIQHLLTHTSGLGDYPSEIDLQRDTRKSNTSSRSKKRRWILRRGLVGTTAISATRRWVFSLEKSPASTTETFYRSGFSSRSV